MKKKLESELMSIAHNILKLKGKDDVIKMHNEVAALHEKLSLLKFAYENFEEQLPTIGDNSSFFEMLNTVFNNTVSDTIEVEGNSYTNIDDNKEEAIMEPAIEKIKDIVAQMPNESHAVDELIDEITADYKETPIFEPLITTEQTQPLSTKTSLNDKLKTGIMQIGLNDKLAFVKHLFDGKNEDYERVLSQINTTISFKEAKNLVQNMVKPDYNGWVGKEDYEQRFMELIESKF